MIQNDFQKNLIYINDKYAIKENIAEYPSNNVFKVLRDINHVDINKIFKSDTLNQLVGYIDTNHPAISTILDGQLNSIDNKSLNVAMQELISVYLQYAKNGNSNSIICENLPAIIKKHPYWKKFNKLNISNAARLIASVSRRGDTRKIQKSVTIGLINFYKKSHIYWANSENWTKYFPTSVWETPANLEMQKRHKFFVDKKLPGIASLVKKEMLLEERNNKSKVYFGFKQINIFDAIAVFARLNDFKMHQETGTLMRNKAYLMPILINPYKSIDLVNDRTKLTIDLCERWADNQGKPIFDHFKILSSTTDGHQASSPYNIKHIAAQKLTGILLGQKDNDLYFINYYL